MGLLRARQAPPDQNENQQFTFSPTIWVPVLIIILVLILLLVASYLRRRMYPSQDAVIAPATSTAEAGTAPRRRRNRRRASQISTHSLPAYMENPGDEELVLVGRRDPMPTLEEGEHRDSMDSGEMPEPQHSTPLLERDPHEMPFSRAVPSERSSMPMPEGMSQMPDASAVSLASVITPTDSAVSMDLPEDHPLGDAPSYTEAIGSTPGAPRAPGTLRTREQRPSTASSESPSTSASLTRNPSLFRSLFNRNEDGSEGSDSVRAAGTSSSSSSVGSRISRLGRQRSMSRPEQIASARLSISAPLPHTLVRTEFTYPRTGPTEAQIQFISSRESLGRFGVPYGDDAIAASVPPPPFELGHGRRPSFTNSILEPTAEEQLTDSPSEVHPPPVPPLPEDVRSRAEMSPSIVTTVEHPTPPHPPPPATPVKSPITPTVPSAPADMSAPPSAPPPAEHGTSE